MPHPPEFITSDLDLAATILTNDSLVFYAIRPAPGNTKDKLFVFLDPDGNGPSIMVTFISGRTEGNIPRFIQTKSQLLTLVRRGGNDEITFRR